MNSVATRRFWALFHVLPTAVQELAIKNYRLWRRDPHHPSLHFRRLKEARIALVFESEITIALSVY